MNKVELHTLGFVVSDDFGPEGRQPVSALVGGDLVPYVFHARYEAMIYADLRNTHAALFAAQGYSDDESEAREACKHYARTHGRVYINAARAGA